MPDEKVVERAREDKEEGKSASTQAGEFVREEMHHIREGKHGARSPQQAIAIGLSKARRAGVDLPPPRKALPRKRRRRPARILERERNLPTANRLARVPARLPVRCGENGGRLRRTRVSRDIREQCRGGEAANPVINPREKLRRHAKIAAHRGRGNEKRGARKKRHGSPRRAPAPFGPTWLNLRSAGQMPDQGDNEQYQEDVENDLGNAGSRYRNTAESENRGY